MKVKCTSTYSGIAGVVPEVGPRDLAKWLESLPIDNSSLELVPVMSHRGSQRDGYEVFTGMTARWEEDR